MRVDGKRKGKLPERSVCYYEKELAGGQTEAVILVIRRLKLFCGRNQFDPGGLRFLASLKAHDNFSKNCLLLDSNPYPFGIR